MLPDIPGDWKLIMMLLLFIFGPVAYAFAGFAGWLDWI